MDSAIRCTNTNTSVELKSHFDRRLTLVYPNLFCHLTVAFEIRKSETCSKITYDQSVGFEINNLYCEA